MTINYDSASVTYDSSTLSFDGYPAPLANMPAVGVFIAWTDGPYVAAPAWTEISQYVRGVTIRRGRSDDLQQFPPGAAQVVLDNRLRYFDPFNSSAPAPFNGNLKPRKQIKIVANWSGVEYPLFRGFVAGWPVEYTDGGLDSTVTIDCFDLLGLLATENNTTNLFVQYMQSLSPVMYWTFEELAQVRGETTVQIFDKGSRGATLNLAMKNQAIEAPEMPGVLEPMIGAYSNNDGGAPYADSVSTSRTGDFSLAFIYKTGSGRFSWTFPGNVVLSALGGSASFTISQLGNTSTSAAFCLEATFSDSGGLARSVSSFISADDQPHLYVINYSYTSQTVTIYIDGVERNVVSATRQVLTPDRFGYFVLRDAVVYPGGSGSSPAYGRVAFNNIAIFHRVLTTDEIGQLSILANALREESSLARYQRTMTYSDVESSLIEYPATTAGTVDEFNFNGRTTLDLLQEVARGEDGAVFSDAAGSLILTDRDFVFSQPRSNTSQVTFTDTGVGVNYDAQGVRLDFDADRVRNSSTVSGTGKVSVTVSDATSIASYGVAGEVVDTVLKDRSQVQSLADRRVTVYKNPKMTVEPFMSKGQQDPAYNWPRLLGLELLDRVTFKRTPATGSAVVKDLLVQSIEHRFTPGTWETVVNGSARYTNWFIVGVSLIGGDDLLLN